MGVFRVRPLFVASVELVLQVLHVASVELVLQLLNGERLIDLVLVVDVEYCRHRMWCLGKLLVPTIAMLAFSRVVL